jgi:hypothetical protein
VSEFVVARNPDPESALPYLVRLPLPTGAVVLKVRETWPRTVKVYCHRATEWPEEPDIVERVPVRSCVARGASIDLVLDRSRENRSQFVFTRARGREAIFWQSARTARKARPNVSVPRARASGQMLEIVVDTAERYAWKFGPQQATTVKRSLPIGDYAVEADGHLVAVVERKSLQDLVGTFLSGKMWFLLAELSSVPRAALVVEHRYADVFKLERVRPAAVADWLAEAAVRYPSVPIMWCDTRALAEEWAYRFFGAAVAQHRVERAALPLFDTLEPAGPVPAPEPTTAEVRAWALRHGYSVPDRGRLKPEIWEAFRADRPAPDTSPPG